MDISNQFILTKSLRSETVFQNNILSIGNYHFYYGQNLSMVKTENSFLKLIVVGELYDFRNPEWTNKQIVNQLLKNFQKIDEVLFKTYAISGEYVFFIFNKNSFEFKVFSDASAQFEIFYSITDEENMIISSSHRLVNMFSPLKEDISTQAIEFYKSEAFLNRRSFVGYVTNYINLMRLKPNHYLNINTGEQERYFPNKKKLEYNLKETSKKCAKMIKGYIEAASKRNKLLIPVTGGWDSRVLLASSKNITQNCVYYVFYNNKLSPKYDVTIPQKIFQKLNIPFYIFKNDLLTPAEEMELEQECFEEILFPRAQSCRNIKKILLKYPNYLNLNGNISEIARLEFDEIFNLNPHKIAFIEKYPFLEYAFNHYKVWFEKNHGLFRKMGYRTLDMLYWEENCGNWVAKYKSESRILGLKTFSPFNSRELLLSLYGLPKKYRRKQNPVVYKKMIEILWPEVLHVPVNPGPKKIAMRITQYLGIFPIFRNLKLWWNLFKGRKHW